MKNTTQFAKLLFLPLVLISCLAPSRSHAQVVSNGTTLSTNVAGLQLIPTNGTGTVLVNSNSTLRNASGTTPSLLISRTNNGTYFITNNGLMTNSGTTSSSQVFDVQVGNYTFVNNASGVMAINPSSIYAVIRSSQFTNAKSGVITNYGLMQGLNSASIVNLGQGAFTFHNEGTVRGSISHYGGNNGSLTVNQVAGEITANAATNFVYALYSAATTSAVNVSGGKITKDIIFEGSNSVNAVNLSGGQINGNIVFNNSSSTNSVLVTGGGLNGNISFSNSTGAVNFDRGDAYSYTNVISGSGRLTNSSGTTTLTANNTYSGGTTINGGTLQVGNGGTSGTLGSGNVTNNSLLVFNRSDAATVSNTISGSGAVTQAGTGTTTLSGANTYTGLTKVNAGTLALGAGGSFSTNSSAEIAGGATLNLAANNQSLKDVKANGTIAGSGTMTVTGTLSGSGTVNADTVVTGTHSPGNSPGIQSFGSSLSYKNASTVLLEFTQNSTAGRGVSFDGIDVAGDLSFDPGSMMTLSFNGAGSTVNWNDQFWNNYVKTSEGWLLYSVGGSISGLNNVTISGSILDSNGLLLSSARPDAYFNLYQVDNNVYLTYTVPEPSTYALIGLGGLAMVVACRRKRG